MYDDSVVIADKESDGSISHHKISLRLRDDMMRKAIMNNRPRMSCYCQPNSRPEAKKPLTQKYLGNIAGCHRSTVSRHLRKQEKVKAISITSFDKIPVYDIEHGEVINDIPNRRPFISGRMAYIRDANEYEILDENIYCRFKHIIYNHPQRLTINRHDYRFAQYDY